MRAFWLGSIAVLLCAGLPSVVGAAADETRIVLSDCDASGLTPSDVDICLERVRILDETSPSPQLESLEAKLEEKKAGKPNSAASEPPAPLQPLQEVTVGPTTAAAAPSASFAGPVSPSIAEPENSSRPAEVANGTDADPGRIASENGPNEASQGSFADDDEPPIADPPDDTTPYERGVDPD
jgi:hypothetical protein